MKLKQYLPQHYIFFFLFVFVVNANAYSQISGCKDPAANNYNPSATLNDGSCTYNTTSYNPPVKVDPLSNTLVETSGLQMAGNFLWSFNDGGNAAAIYRVDTTNGNILQTVNLGGVTNVDWEDMAFDGTYFYIGDFGNNLDGARTDLKIYKFSFSSIPDYNTDPIATIPSAQIEVINFSYADQVPIVPASANNTRFDCEAMIVDAGMIHLFSKNWVDLNTTHYVISSTIPGTYVAAPIEILATNYLVTSADKVPGSNIIVLLGYQNGIPGNHFMHLLSDFSAGFYFNGNKRKFNLPSALTMGQAEGICFRNTTYGYISNEEITSFSITPKLRSFNTSSFIPAYLLPVDLVDFNVKLKNDKHLISWNFASPVNELQVLYSGDRVNFVPLKNISTSKNGSFSYVPSTAINCYKLVWQSADGGNKSSNIVCLNAAITRNLYNVVLHANGQLQFISNDNDECFIRLLSLDGKLISQTNSSISKGSNSIHLGGEVLAGTTIIMQMIGNKSQSSILLKVIE